MTGESIFWPMLVQALLTFAVYGLVSYRRMSAIKSGTTKPSDYRIPTVEPESSATAARSLINQFELPVLFYAACLVLFVLGAANLAAILIAWLFALSRLVHAFVHVTSNRLRYRRPLFITGYFSVLGMWLLIGLHLAGLA